MDNLKTVRLENGYQRTCFNFAQLAYIIYKNSSTPLISTKELRLLLKRNVEERSSVKIVSFCNMIRFKAAVPSLIKLLSAGGIWSVNCEQAFGALHKCRIEEVCDV